MDWYGMAIGAISFLTIGLFHPIVIKCEYYFSAKVWPVFLLAGIGLCFGSAFAGNRMLSATLAVTGFSCLWSILELKEQEKRVKKGWFPKNPKREQKKAYAMPGEHPVNITKRKEQQYERASEINQRRGSADSLQQKFHDCRTGQSDSHAECVADGEDDPF